MVELKTLKDLPKVVRISRVNLMPENNELCIDAIKIEDLRQEAISQIKEMLKIKYNQKGYTQSRINMKWIKWFFNITEEELK